MTQKDDSEHTEHRLSASMPLDVHIPCHREGVAGRQTRAAMAQNEAEAFRGQWDHISQIRESDREPASPGAPALDDDSAPSDDPGTLLSLQQQNLAVQQWPYTSVDDEECVNFFLAEPDTRPDGVLLPASLPEEALDGLFPDGLSSEEDEAGGAMQRANVGHLLPRHVLEKDMSPVFDDAERLSLQLHDLLEHANCPLYVFDKIVKIFRESPLQHPNDLLAVPSRAKFLENMMERVKTCRPQVRVVELETRHAQSPDGIYRGVRDFVSVVHYDFKTQLLDLLSDELFHNLGNLVVNPNSPFDPYVPQTDVFEDDRQSLEEALDGTVYQHYIQRLKDSAEFDPDFDFVLPIVLYTDKTGTDAYQRYSLEPVVFTTTMIGCHLRQDTQRCWRSLGFVPDLDLKSTASKKVSSNTKAGRGRSLRNYHKCLSVVLESLLELQKAKPIVALRLGDRVKICRLRLPIHMVSGDGLSGDHICGRVGGYGPGTSRISRSCNRSFERADDFDGDCITTRPSSNKRCPTKIFGGVIKNLVHPFIFDGPTMATGTAHLIICDASKLCCGNQNFACSPDLTTLV